MKSLRFFACNLVLILAVSVLAIAQTERTQTAPAVKIAVIKSAAFDNKVTGIKEIVEAYDKLEAEIKPKADELNLMAEKIQKLEKELRRFTGMCPEPFTKESLDKLLSDYETAICKYTSRLNEIKSIYEKRKSEIFAEANNKIREALKQFAKEKDFAVLLDNSDDDSSVLIEGKTIDVTNEFIKFYNEEFCKKKGIMENTGGN